jgi:asparagine synthetase B (glutamine-hydrolysing)
VEELLNYNFVPADVRDGDFAALYERRRRDSVFAFAYRDEAGGTFALRDHLGVVPLYYRQGPDGVRFSLAMKDLVCEGDELDERGAELFVAYGTCKLNPPVRGIGSVDPGTVVRFGEDGAPPEVVHRHVIPSTPTLSGSLDEVVDEVDRLMQRSVERTLTSDSVGIYMSGGIDSALVAHCLKRAGVHVSAYTSAPWGDDSTDVPFAQLNVEHLGVDRHTIVPLETADYESYVQAAGRLYGSPHGVVTAIGVAALFENSDIGDCEQVYSGLHADALICSTPSGCLVYFTHRLPRALKRRVHPTLRHRDALADLLCFESRGAETHYDDFLYVNRELAPIPQLIIGGIHIAGTVHSEVFADPVIQKGAIVGNPYYDMDFVDLCVRLPLRHRLAFSWSSRTKLILEKRILQKVAERYLPPEVVYRKKAFTIPFKRDAASRAYEESLPTSFDGRELTDRDQRYAAEILRRFVSERQIGEGAARELASPA